MRFLRKNLFPTAVSLALLLSLLPVPSSAANASPYDAGNLLLSSKVSDDYCTIDIIDSEHGQITASPDQAKLFDTVILTVFPDEGYKLGQVTVTSSAGKPLELSVAGESKYSFTINARAVIVQADFIPKQISLPTISFADVSASAWYADAVYYVAERGIMSGSGDNTFSPDDSLTRAMLAQILYAMEGKPHIGSINYGDVSYEDWYYDAVAWARAKEIMTGYQEGYFGPNIPVTREQVALILLKYAKLHGYDTRVTNDLSGYSDCSSVSSWAQSAMAWAIEAGILSARENSLLDPGTPATRAEIAQSLMELCKLAEK